MKDNVYSMVSWPRLVLQLCAHSRVNAIVKIVIRVVPDFFFQIVCFCSFQAYLLLIHMVSITYSDTHFIMTLRRMFFGKIQIKIVKRSSSSSSTSNGRLQLFGNLIRNEISYYTLDLNVYLKKKKKKKRIGIKTF